MAAYYSGQSGALPFWINPGLKFTTVIYAAGLTVAGAALLGVLPALKVTGSHVQAQLRNLGAGGSTLRFGWVWTTRDDRPGGADGHLHSAARWASRRRRGAIA